MSVEQLLTELATAGWLVRVWTGCERWYVELLNYNGEAHRYDAPTLAGALARAYGG